MVSENSPTGAGNFLAVKTLFIWLLLSTMVIALLLHFYPGRHWLLALKDASIAIYILINIFALGSIVKCAPVWFWLLPALLIIWAIASDTAISARLASLRQVWMPFALLICGMIAGRRGLTPERMYRFLTGCALGLILIGAVFYFVPIWRLIPLDAYAAIKRIDTATADNILPMFYDPMLPGIQRLYSTLLDPINMGHLLVTVLVISIYKSPRHPVLIAIFGLALAATVCKGAILQLLLCLLLLGTKRFRLNAWQKLTGVAGAVAGLIIAAKFHPGVLMHLQGLEAALRHVSLFGSGLGAAGNQAAMYSSLQGSGIGDTFLGAVIGQTGIIGLLCWLSPFIWLIVRLRSARVLRTLLITQLLVAAISENAFNLLSILFLMFLCGLEIARRCAAPRPVAIVDHVGAKAGMDHYSGSLAEAFSSTGLSTIVISNFIGSPTPFLHFRRCFPRHKKSMLARTFGFFYGFAGAGIACIEENCGIAIVHLFSYGWKDVAAWLLLRASGVKLIAIVHDVEAFAGSGSSRIAARILLKYLAKELVVHNTFSRDALLAKQGADLAPLISVIPHGHYHHLFGHHSNKAAARETLKLDADRNYILFFGQIKEEKGLDILLNAMTQVSPDAMLIIAGKPWKMGFARYQNMIDELQHGGRIITFLRFIPDNERDLLFNAVDCIVLPYRVIYQSGVLLTAISAHVPVVVSDLQPNLDLIRNGFSGHVFRQGDASDLALQINKVLAAPEEASALADNAYDEISKSHSWGGIALKYVSLIEKIYGKHLTTANGHTA